jgi:two-component system chemotaxis response regulator CheB
MASLSDDDNRDNLASNAPGRVIVIGADEGGSQALVTLVRALPPGIPAAVLVVIHSNAAHSQLPRLLSGAGMEAAYARSGEPIQAGRVYIAGTDEHLVIDNMAIRLARGPSEHGCRPAIDPLFRSAALAFGEAVIGVLLTGELDDGVAGLQDIKRLGGQVVVQDPGDAFSPGMPQAALECCEVDHCLPLDAIAPLLGELSRKRPEPPVGEHRPDAQTVERLRSEVEISLVEGDPAGHVAAIGTPSPFTCPDCHGGLWEVHDAHPTLFRCHTGHVFTERTMERAMAVVSRDALWNACRAVQERQILLERMARSRRGLHDGAAADGLDDAARELRDQVLTMRSVLQRGPGADLDTSRMRHASQ